MSVLGPHYNPHPTREWYRFQNAFSEDIPQPSVSTLLENVNYNEVPKAYKYQLATYKKGNILQYKKNSADLTKNQRYAQIAKGAWTNRTKTWSSQSETISNPNSDLLKRVSYETYIYPNYGVDGTEIIEPILSTTPITNCSLGTTLNFAPLPTTSKSTYNSTNLPATAKSSTNISMPPYVYKPKILNPTAIQTGGSLIGTIVENPCTNEILDETFTQDCYPSSASDVPGSSTTLCWNDGLQTYYPKTKLTYGTSGNKWPTNSKFIFPA
jgi:hypothetical protein